MVPFLIVSWVALIVVSYKIVSKSAGESWEVVNYKIFSNLSEREDPYGSSRFLFLWLYSLLGVKHEIAAVQGI